MSTKTLQNDKKKENLSGSNSLALKVILLITLGVLLRLIVMTSKYQIIIANHVEVSTPLSSWKRVLEGTFLLSKNVNPYNGDLLHETPLGLKFYKAMLKYVFRNVNIMFIAFDIGTGLLLFAATKKYSRIFQEEYKHKGNYPEDVQEYLPKDNFYQKVPVYVLMASLFNPYSMLGCIGHSTMGIHNFFLSLFILGMVSGSIFISSLALAVCASVSLYPVILILPLSIYFLNVHHSKTKAVSVVISFLFFSFFILAYNSDFGKNFSYVKNVYGCILTVPDLQPNIGLFWYFFTEMFDHFRELFIYSFQINATILYLVPLSIKFRNRPFVLTVALLFLIAIFKSYPCLSDLGFVLSFLPNFLHLFAYCQQGFVVSVILLMTSCLAPILWHLWIYSASANANFFFGVTLAYAIAQIFLVTDILFAQTKWEFSLQHGKETKLDGENATLSLE